MLSTLFHWSAKFAKHYSILSRGEGGWSGLMYKSSVSRTKTWKWRDFPTVREDWLSPEYLASHCLHHLWPPWKNRRRWVAVPNAYIFKLHTPFTRDPSHQQTDASWRRAHVSNVHGGNSSLKYWSLWDGQRSPWSLKQFQNDCLHSKIVP